MSKFVVVSFLQDPPAAFQASDWPLHVTIIRPFVTDTSLSELTSAIERISADSQKSDVVGKGKEVFGPEKRSVTELELSPQLQELHEDAMREFGSYVIPESHVFSFRPHVTDQVSGTLDVDEGATLSSLSLVEMDGEERRVAHTSMFS